MDRYEYNVKSDQIKKLYNKKDYQGAAEIADTIDWSRVKHNSMLAIVADAYEGAKQYDKAREVLEIAYERSPLGRQLAYRLTILSVRMRDFVEADRYYHEFVEMAPRDVAQYILKYRISRAKGDDIDNLISILEAYLDVEMDERWQYELAKLYHESGQDTKCVEMCDKIILWFSEGKYVTKAMELKMKHESLTEEQQAKYDGKWDYYNEKIKAEEKEKAALLSESGEDTEESGEDSQGEDENVSDEENTDEVSEDSEAGEGSSEDDSDEKNQSPEERWPQHDILNDTTALDYLTDYTEEEKINHEPDTETVDEVTAMEVEINLARVVEESVEDAKKDADEEDENEINEIDENDDPYDFSEKKDIENMDESEIIADAYVRAEEDETGESEEHIDDSNDDSQDNKIEIYESSENNNDDNLGEELMKTSEIDIDEINFKVAPAGNNVYDTANIQEALAQSMAIIMKAESEKQFKESMMQPEIMDEPTKRIGKELGNEGISRNAFDEPEDADDEDVKKPHKPVYETVPLQPIYDKEEDGQIKLIDTIEVDEQVEGQMNIEDVLLEFENRKKAALEEAEKKEKIAKDAVERAMKEAAAAREAVEKALAEEEAARLALEKASRSQKELMDTRTLDELAALDKVAGNLGIDLSDKKKVDELISEMSSQPDNDIKAEATEPAEEPVEPAEPVEATVPTVSDEPAEAAETEEDTAPAFTTESQEAEVKSVLESTERELAAAVEAVASQMEPEVNEAEATHIEPEVNEAATQVEPEVNEAATQIEPEVNEVEEAQIEPEVNEAAESVAEVAATSAEPEEKQAVEGHESDTQNAVTGETYGFGDHVEVADDVLADISKAVQEEYDKIVSSGYNEPENTAYNTLEAIAATADENAAIRIERERHEAETKIPEEHRKLFANFLDIPGLEEQVAATIKNLTENFVKDGTSKTNNVMIMGDAKVGKTTLALNIIKAANKGRDRASRKVAKVKATALNRKGVGAAMSQILGTDLIIEQAGNLMPGTVVDLMASMKAYTEEMIIVLEDDKAALERLVTAHPALEDMFSNQIYIKEFNIDDYVKIAKDYAETKGYVIDEMGTLALYAKIDDINGKNQGISRPEIYEIIDEAVAYAERFKFSKIIDKIKKTHYEMGVLKEEDFD